MKLEKGSLGVIKWFARITALFFLVIGLMFYFGYGNPLPSPEYSLWENVMLTALPLTFIGLALGWWREKWGGYLTVAPVVIGMLLGLITGEAVSINFLFPLIPGILYFIVGYNQDSHVR
ncbi:MAG: hypothetical protein WC400_00660 [Patescibacteria group bacterium]|jgi:hypothetical protein